MSSKNAREGLWGLGTLIGLSILVAVYLIYLIAQTLVPHHHKITVKGYNERKIESNYATWQGSISTRSPTLIDAYHQLEKDLNLVFAYVQKAGLAKEDLQVSAVQISIFYRLNDKGSQTNEIEGYQLRQDLTISSKKVALISQIANQITSLIKEGIEISSFKPQYFYTKIDELKIEMLGEAAKDALARAQQLATNSGSHVGKLHSAQQGVFQITPIYSTSVSDYGENDTSSIEKSIKAVVTMEYGIL